MGTWGPGIFSNDTACDVRVAYRMALEDGLDDQAAQGQVLDEFAEVLHDDTWHDGPLVWLALAKTQWQLGRLDDHVKAEALAVIDQGRDLASWEGSDLYGYRRAVLRRLRQQLTTPPPPRIRLGRHRHRRPGHRLGRGGRGGLPGTTPGRLWLGHRHARADPLVLPRHHHLCD